MLILQIRQAEVALADGRLDEAYKLVQSEEIRSHRRGQALITELVDRLITRAQSHFDEDRLPLALADCERANQLGGNRDDVASLRSKIETAIVSNDRDHRNDARTLAVQFAADRIDSAIGRQDLDRAVSELARARTNGCSDHRLRELDANVRTNLSKQIESALKGGRLDQAQPLFQRLEQLDPQGLLTQQHRRMIEQTCAAWNAVESHQPRQAIEILRRLSAQLDAGWIDEAMQQLKVADESMQSVRSGPLGMLTMDQPQPIREDLPPRQRAQEADVQLPARFIVQVDGCGSYLVLPKSIVTLGPISSSQRPDVGLIAEADAQLITVERIEDDYFLKSANGSSRLLASGERILLSPRCKLTFSLPNPSSTSAALDLSSGRFPRADVRRVILLDRDLIIGPGAAAHVRADHLNGPLVLHVRDGGLWCKDQQLNLGSPVTIAGASFVVTAA